MQQGKDLPLRNLGYQIPIHWRNIAAGNQHIDTIDFGFKQLEVAFIKQLAKIAWVEILQAALACQVLVRMQLDLALIVGEEHIAALLYLEGVEQAHHIVEWLGQPHQAATVGLLIVNEEFDLAVGFGKHIQHAFLATVSVVEKPAILLLVEDPQKAVLGVIGRCFPIGIGGLCQVILTSHILELRNDQRDFGFRASLFQPVSEHLTVGQLFGAIHQRADFQIQLIADLQH